jgi:glycosyltransferase involved in cell wall biosynthesis
MKIGLVCQNYPPASFEGGISHYSAHLARNLNHLGHTVLAFTSTEFLKPTHGSEVASGVRIAPVKGPWDKVSVATIKKIAADQKLDALVLQYSPVSYRRSFRLAWAATRFPCLETIAFHTLWGSGVDRFIAFLLLLGCDKIIATNSEILYLLEKYLPCFLRKTCWIPIGSNILPSGLQDQEQYSDVDGLFSFFGMLYSGKGLNLIVDVLETLKRQGHRFAFKLIGGGGMSEHQQYEKDIGCIVREKKLTDRVELLGRLSEGEVSAWLDQSRFIFLPYESGLSDRRGTLMAAMAHGKAVLTSPPAVPMHFFKNGANVIWPAETSVSAYVNLIEKLLKDDALTTRLGQGAAELAADFSWERITAAHELILLQELSKT